MPAGPRKREFHAKSEGRPALTQRSSNRLDHVRVRLNLPCTKPSRGHVGFHANGKLPQSSRHKDVQGTPCNGLAMLLHKMPSLRQHQGWRAAANQLLQGLHDP